MSIPNQPLVSICIPTFNRPTELAETLRILADEMRLLGEQYWDDFEIIVSDNASPIGSPAAIVEPYANRPLRAALFEQSRNVGPTLNFESCLQRARGRHVLLLSDDDHLTPGSLALVHTSLKQQDPDILFLPFSPQNAYTDGVERLERDDFLVRVGYLPSLVSACILKRSLIEPVLGRYLDTHMHHFFYFLTALERGDVFLRLERQVLFCPYEGNPGGYNWFRTFGEELPRILTEFPRQRIGRRALSSVLSQLLKGLVLPTFLNRKISGVVVNKKFAVDDTWSLFKIVARNFGFLPSFWFFFVPVALTPRVVLRSLKRAYLWQKGFLFQWHAS